MRFENHFSVQAPIAQVWDFLLDVPQVAPCVPGGELTEVVSDTEYKGIVKIKLGAVQMTYRGTVVLKEIDTEDRRIVLTASGSETRGTGNASGTVTSTLVAEGPSRTAVDVVAEVNVTGRVAQFGRNIMQEVSTRLVGEFARCLEEKLTTAAGSMTISRDTGTAGSSDTMAEGGTTGESDNQTVPGTSSGPTPAPSPAGQPVSASTPGSAGMSQAEPIKMLPLAVDIARVGLASGLRKLAKLIEHE